MAVFVLDRKGKPLMPCSEKRARLLLERGRARLHKMYPFTIRLVDRLQSESGLQPVSVKIDPGSKETGLAVARMAGKDVHCLYLANLVHRGRQISRKLLARKGFRKGRRSRNTRYRAPRFLNRGNKKKGWLAPSLMHRVNTTLSWVNRFRKLAPIDGLSVERVKFDMQKMQNPEISGTEYQRGTLAGFEIREYLLEKWGRKCAYCHAEQVPLQIEHIVPKIGGGSNAVSNLTLACDPCNQAKGKKSIKEFLANKPEELKKILSQLKSSLKDAAAVNATRDQIFVALLATGLPVETGTGGQTKFNRSRLGIEKDHALDAACVGDVGVVFNTDIPVIEIKCSGRGQYQRTNPDSSGFPRLYLTRRKLHFGFQTGDMVKATVKSGKKAGTHLGRVAVRKKGSFNIGKIQGIGYRHCKLIQRADGYSYLTKIANKSEVARLAA